MTSNAQTERWYSVDEIAVHLGIGRETVYRWIDRRGLPAHRLGKFWKFKISEVDDWVRAGASAGVVVYAGISGRIGRNTQQMGRRTLGPAFTVKPAKNRHGKTVATGACVPVAKRH